MMESSSELASTSSYSYCIASGRRYNILHLIAGNFIQRHIMIVVVKSKQQVVVYSKNVYSKLAK